MYRINWIISILPINVQTFKHSNNFTTNNEPITCTRIKKSYLAKEICCVHQWCFSLLPETLVNPAFMTFLWCFRGFTRSYSSKGGHVVIEIPGNLSSFRFTPCAYFMEYLTQKWVANKAKYSNSAQTKNCYTSEQNIEQNHQLWDIINVLALGIFKTFPNMHVTALFENSLSISHLHQISTLQFPR